MSLVSMMAINKKISETKEQIAAFQTDSDEQSTLSQFMLSELVRRLEALEKEKEEMLQAQSKETVSLRIYGEQIEQGKISNRILVSVLDGFQSMIDGIAQTIEGAEGTRGKFTDKAKMLTDFQVAGTFPGSFGIVLEKNYEQMEVASGASNTTKVLDEFFCLLENSSNSEKLIEHISPFGQRTVNHYKNWLKSLNDYSVSVEVDWKDENAQSRKMDINWVNMKDTIFTLESIESIETENIEFYNAVITGVNIRNNTFELRTENGDLIKGKSKTEVLISLSGDLGKEVDVRLTKSTSSTQANVINISWYLVEKIKINNK